MIVYADQATVAPDGSLVFLRRGDGTLPDIIYLAFAPGHWTIFFSIEEGDLSSRNTNESWKRR